MRRALFERSGVPCSIPLDKVLHILTAPAVFKLPLLRPAFVGAFVYDERVVPLLAGESRRVDGGAEQEVPFVLVCEAEFGLVGIPADKILKITRAGEIESGGADHGGSSGQSCEINGRDYRQLELNDVLEESGFSVSGM